MESWDLTKALLMRDAIKAAIVLVIFVAIVTWALIHASIDDRRRRRQAKADNARPYGR